MTEEANNPNGFDQEMSEYLQTFLDETEEQLDDLVETLLALEKAPDSTENLNESFRLVHSIKGSAGMMGLDRITVLTHHLENRFERFRSGTEALDVSTMNLVLRCIDFLRQCTNRLREGESLSSPAELLQELKRLEDQSDAPKQDLPASPTTETGQLAEPVAGEEKTESEENAEATQRGNQGISRQSPEPMGEPLVCLTVQFRSGLLLADLKAQLILNRLAKLGTIRSTDPTADSLSENAQLEKLEICLETNQEQTALQEAAEVDGVESTHFQQSTQLQTAHDSTEANVPDQGELIATDKPVESVAERPSVDKIEAGNDVEANGGGGGSPNREATSQSGSPESGTDAAADPQVVTTKTPETPPDQLLGATQSIVPTSSNTASEPQPKVVAETMRVGIDRLDNLMNLAGELVVNRAQFVQISEQLTPVQQRTKTLNQMRGFCDALQQTIKGLETEPIESGDREALADQLRAGLQWMDEHSQAWEHDRQYIEKFGEAIDQLARVSQGLQRGVLDTRMVPVGPLFNRFKRVVRDLSKERGKQVNLSIHGEKTELDKRMIDELGDPLMHLVRNALDHGLEPTDARIENGKPDVGTIALEATHSGNNVYVHVRDDGRGIDVQKIKAKLIRTGILSKAETSELSDEQALEYIWHPGFSTADQVTDISGRGVGMDVVQDRVRQLNGSLSVDSSPGRGTQFTIRLPLTLAIINCLLVRIRDVIFSMPIDHIREIVSVSSDDIIQIRGQRTIDVRDELIPLARIDDIFDWNDSEISMSHAAPSNPKTEELHVVILQVTGKMIGLQVDELLGSQDMVIKSLADNFVDIAGLSGASILGDGSVCLMLDAGTIFQILSGPSLRSDAQDTAI